MFETIKIDVDARGVATLTLNRVDKHNALSAVMLAELTQAAADLGADDAVRVVVLTGAGKSFCAGGDLEWMREQMQADAETRGLWNFSIVWGKLYGVRDSFVCGVVCINGVALIMIKCRANVPTFISVCCPTSYY